MRANKMQRIQKKCFKPLKSFRFRSHFCIKNKLLKSVVILFLAFICTHNSAAALAADVAIVDRQIFLDGKPFIMKGVGYSPVPIGIDPETASPYGDYFTPEYSPIYGRDIPMLRRMGANTIRLWGWNNVADHSDFLDEAYNGGDDPIYVVVTFWMGPSLYPDIASVEARAKIKSAFRNMVAVHKNHPAVLMWSIGNELNAPWNYGNHLDDLFSLIEEMALEAHTEEGSAYHPATSPLADIDLIPTIASYDSSLNHLDFWSVQVYRGRSFGSLFSDYRNASPKPLAILEYGIDAYDDENGGEYENIGLPYQALYARALWREIFKNSDVCVGGSIMAYSDEWWKGKYGNTDSDHPSCPENDPWLLSTCGYPNSAHPDGYSNEEWWGIMRTLDNGADPDILEPRRIYYTLMSLWKPTGMSCFPLLLLDD
jgi:hypothetical protein